MAPDTKSGTPVTFLLLEVPQWDVFPFNAECKFPMMTNEWQTTDQNFLKQSFAH